jgi:glycosyltransferase involved in cell wall biosynthesis
LKVLVLGHSTGQIGGVSNFLRMMQEKGVLDIQIEMQIVGPRDGESNKIGRIFRLLWDYISFLRNMFDNFDCVHMNPSLDRRSFVRTMVFVLMCVVFRKKFIIFFRGWDWSAFEYYFQGQGITSRVVRNLVSRSFCLIVLAPSFKNALADIYASLPIHVTTTMFNGNIMPKEVDRAFKGPVILFMSRFISAKGGIESIDAFVEIKKRHPGASLLMAGDGRDKPLWERHAESYGLEGNGIEFIGYVKGDTKTEALRIADVFLMPSQHPEGMPNALMEAMGAGLIPIVTEVGGTFDAIRHGEYGYMLSSCNRGEIAQIIDEIMSDKDAARELSKMIRAHAWNSFESDVVIKQIAEVYRSVAR